MRIIISICLFSDGSHILQSRYLYFLSSLEEQMCGEQCERAPFSFPFHRGFYVIISDKTNCNIHNVLLLNINFFFKNKEKHLSNPLKICYEVMTGKLDLQCLGSIHFSHTGPIIIWEDIGKYSGAAISYS